MLFRILFRHCHLDTGFRINVFACLNLQLVQHGTEWMHFTVRRWFTQALKAALRSVNIDLAQIERVASGSHVGTGRVGRQTYHSLITIGFKLYSRSWQSTGLSRGQIIVDTLQGRISQFDQHVRLVALLVWLRMQSKRSLTHADFGRHFERRRNGRNAIESK